MRSLSATHDSVAVAYILFFIYLLLLFLGLFVSLLVAPHTLRCLLLRMICTCVAHGGSHLRTRAVLTCTSDCKAIEVENLLQYFTIRCNVFELRTCTRSMCNHTSEYSTTLQLLPTYHSCISIISHLISLTQKIRRTPVLLLIFCLLLFWVYLTLFYSIYLTFISCPAYIVYLSYTCPAYASPGIIVSTLILWVYSWVSIYLSCITTCSGGI